MATQEEVDQAKLDAQHALLVSITRLGQPNQTVPGWTAVRDAAQAFRYLDGEH